MKLVILILSIYLTTSVEDMTNITTNIMTKDIEKTFYNLTKKQTYYYTIRAYNQRKYTFRLKVQRGYISSSSSLSLSYIGHNSSIPSEYKPDIIDEGSLYLTSSSSRGYNIYQSQYKVTKSSINYVTFVLTPIKNISSVSIIIFEYNYENKDSSSVVDFELIGIFLTIFLALLAITLVICIFGKDTICKCCRKKTIIQPVPQNKYDTPLTPIYPSSSDFQSQPEYMAPSDYIQANQYAQPPQYLDPQINTY